MLSRLGYEAYAVTNGLEALKAFEDRAYDLVLMDILMPKMDGLAAAAEIRRRLPASKLPIIIAYTAYIYHGNEMKDFFKNFDGYLYKPVRIEELRAAAEANLRVLDRRRSNAITEILRQ